MVGLGPTMMVFSLHRGGAATSSLGLPVAIGHKAAMKPRIMYIESKAEGLNGPARIRAIPLMWGS
jgi:hypothetical protein